MFEVFFYDRNGEILRHGVYDTWTDIEVNRPVECVRVDIAVAYKGFHLGTNLARQTLTPKGKQVSCKQSPFSGGFPGMLPSRTSPVL